MVIEIMKVVMAHKNILKLPVPSLPTHPNRQSEGHMQPFKQVEAVDEVSTCTGAPKTPTSSSNQVSTAPQQPARPRTLLSQIDVPTQQMSMHALRAALRLADALVVSLSSWP